MVAGGGGQRPGSDTLPSPIVRPLAGPWSGGRAAGPPGPRGRRQGGGRRGEAEVPGQDGWRAWVQPCRRAGAPAPLGGAGRGLLTLGRATYLHPAGPGAKCPLPPLPHPGASALTGPASQRPSESRRVPNPSLQRPFSTPAPRSGRKSVLPGFRHLSLPGGRGRSCSLLSPASAGPRPEGHPSYPSGFPGSPLPQSPPNEGTPLIRPRLCWGCPNKNVEFLLFSPLNPVSDSVSRPGLKWKEGKRNF